MSASQIPPLQAKQSSKRCSNCSSLMSLYDLPGHYGRNLEVDVCLECNAIWFDEWENSQLSPDGVVGLFRLIHERGGTASIAGSKLSEGLRCVTCGDGMKLINDRVKHTRFVYQSCRHGHGRFTTFYNFLSEKQFVRELTPAERSKLCATVRQVRCSGCGAPVDLAKHDACAYCRAPVSVFDRDAARKAIDHYLQERQKPVPAQRPSIDYGHAPNHREGWDAWDKLYAADLAADLLFALGRAATRGFARPGSAATGAIGAGAVLADAGTAASSTTDLPGGLLDSLHKATPGGALADSAGTSDMATATDVLFGGANDVTVALGSSGTIGEMAGEAGSLATGALDDALGGAGSSLSSATDALFGSTAASDWFSSASSGAGEVVASAAESLTQVSGDVASGLGESISEIASGAGDGVVDLVSDGIGSLITSIFD